MTPIVDKEVIEILSSSSSSDSSDNEDFDIFGLNNIKPNHQTYQDQRRSNRISYRQQIQEENNKKRKQVATKGIFDIEVPAIFQTKGARLHDINKRYKSINHDIQKDEENLKFQYEKLQQQKSKIIMELNDNGSKGFQKYDQKEDFELIDNLINQQLNGSGIDRHFYFLRDVDGIDLGDFQKIPHSLLFLIKRDPSSGYNAVKSQLKNFIMNSLDSIVNPIHLQSIIDMILHFGVTTNKEVIFTSRELVELIDTCGGNTKLINETKLPIKIGQFNNHLRIQLMRIALILICYLIGDSVDWDIFFKLFIMIICDHNTNTREFETMFYLMDSVWKVISFKYQYDDFIDALDRQVRSLSTYTYGEYDQQKDDDDDDDDIPSHMFTIKTKGDYDLIAQVINKLDLSASIEKDLRQVELKEDMSNLYDFSLKVKLLIIEYGPMTEVNIKELRKSRNIILELKKKVYQYMSKITSPDYKNESRMHREEMVALITEAYQSLEYLGDILLKKCDYLDGDIFYKDIDDEI